jgi:hypothetical protein
MYNAVQKYKKTLPNLGWLLQVKLISMASILIWAGSAVLKLGKDRTRYVLSLASAAMGWVLQGMNQSERQSCD